MREEIRLWNPFILCLAGVVAASWTVLLVLESEITFFADEWAFLIDRTGRSVGVFLDPHNEHIVLAPVSIYKSLAATLGIDSAFPVQVISTLVFLLSATLLFAYLRRRLGDWPALLGSALILFLGASWIDLLWAFQIGYSGSIAAGLGALLALDRDDRVGDRIACALLVVATSFSSLGVPFVVGALVSVLVGGRPRIGRLYVAFVPLALYAIWWLGWGHTAETRLSLENVLESPKFVFDAASQAMASLLGLATPLTGNGAEPVGLIWGHILLVAGVGLAVWRFWRLGRVPRPVWVVLAIGGSFWFLTALNAWFLREPTSVRYQYPGAVFLLLIAAEVLRGVRINARALALGSALTALAVLSGLWFLHLGQSNFLKPSSEGLRARLAAVEITRDRVDPGFMVPTSVFTATDARTYLSVADAYGSPAYSVSELASATAAARAAADDVLVRSLGIELGTGRGSRPDGQGGNSCQTVAATPTGATGLTLSPGEVTLRARPGASAEVVVARYADGFPVVLGPLVAGSAASVELPVDRSTRPWRLGLRGAGRVTVCESGVAQTSGPVSNVSESDSDEDGGTSPLVPIVIAIGAVGLLVGGAWWARNEPVPISAGGDL